MRKILITSMLLSFNFLSIYAIPKYPADISYLISDFKYNKTDGLKICEVQHGSLSVMKGDLIIHGDNGDIPPKIAEFFSQFPV